MKQCRKCGEVKQFDEFHRWSRSPDGRKPRCKLCNSTDARARRLADPERAKATWQRNYSRNRTRILEYHRRYRSDNPEYSRLSASRHYARKRGALTVLFGPEELQLRLSMFPGCWMCGGPKEHVDHVKPLAAGGAHILANLRPACARCNQRKSAKWGGVRLVRELSVG